MENLAHLCEQVKSICVSVGQWVKTQVGQVSQTQIEVKDLNSLVSYVDKYAENQLISQLGKLLIGSDFLAEESGENTQNQSEFLWIIDPLDGTTNFLHGIPFFAISVALQHKGQTVLGLIYDIMHENSYYSYGANQSFCDGIPIKVSAQPLFNQSLVATGFPYYDFKYRQHYLSMIGELMSETRGLRRLGSAALDLAYVACGRFEGFFEYSLSPWDVAAGAFIVQQAGGQVSDFGNGTNYLHGKEIIAGNPACQTALLVCIKKHFHANL
jgi:myo-inositol-1(or 4)-monophosphatase